VSRKAVRQVAQVVASTCGIKSFSRLDCFNPDAASFLWFTSLAMRNGQKGEVELSAANILAAIHAEGLLREAAGQVTPAKSSETMPELCG